MLMDYDHLYFGIVYYHHIIMYIGFWGQVAGIKLWVACSTVVFFERSDEVGF
jgi:hypothetical protein